MPVYMQQRYQACRKLQLTKESCMYGFLHSPDTRWTFWHLTQQRHHHRLQEQQRGKQYTDLLLLVITDVIAKPQDCS